MRSIERENRIVVKNRRRPGRFAVAGGTIRWILRCNVVRIGGRVVIGGVAASAGIRRVVVISIMAGSAIIGNTRMRSI